MGAGVACVCTANETENEAKLGERVRERDSTGIEAAAVSGKLRGCWGSGAWILKGYRTGKLATVALYKL